MLEVVVVGAVNVFCVVGYIILLYGIYYFSSICVGKIDKVTFGKVKKLNF